MESQLILDVLGEDGRVISRHRLREFPVRVGRGASNDLHLEDEHVCEAHFEILRNENGDLFVRNLSAVNGLTEGKRRTRINELPIGAGCKFKAGETFIRIAPIPFEVPAAKRLSRRRKDSHWGSVIALFIACFGASMMENTLLAYNPEENRYTSALVMSLTALVVACTIWGGSWSFFGRMMIHRFRLSSHLSLTLGAFLLSVFAFNFVDYFRFATAWPKAAFWMQWWFVATLLSILIGRHLRLSTTLSNFARTIYAVAIAAVVCGISGLYQYSKSVRYSNSTPAIQSVKPNYFRLARPSTVPMLLAEMDKLEKVVRDDLREMADDGKSSERRLSPAGSKKKIPPEQSSPAKGAKAQASPGESSSTQ